VVRASNSGLSWLGVEFTTSFAIFAHDQPGHPDPKRPIAALVNASLNEAENRLDPR